MAEAPFMASVRPQNSSINIILGASKVTPRSLKWLRWIRNCLQNKRFSNTKIIFGQSLQKSKKSFMASAYTTMVAALLLGGCSSDRANVQRGSEVGDTVPRSPFCQQVVAIIDSGRSKFRGVKGGLVENRGLDGSIYESSMGITGSYECRITASIVDPELTCFFGPVDMTEGIGAAKALMRSLDRDLTSCLLAGRMVEFPREYSNIVPANYNDDYPSTYYTNSGSLMPRVRLDLVGSPVGEYIVEMSFRR